MASLHSDKMTMPRVSFIVPVLNGERDIVRCLVSIKNQKAPQDEYEVLVMDNGSTDGTRALVRSLGFDCRVVPRVNVSALRNQGAALARGGFLAFIDSDVELMPNWLQAALDGFWDSTVVAAGCFPGVPPDATWVQRNWDLHQRRHEREGPAPVSWMTSMNLMVRKDVFHAVSGFKESLVTAEDVDLCYRLGTRGCILSNPAMEAIHWGEARDVKVFWRKEVWRGIGNLQGVFSHGFKWDELPSLGYPLYMGVGAVLATSGTIVDLLDSTLFWGPIGLVLLLLPSLLLAANTARISRRFTQIPPLIILYCLYGMARAVAMLESFRTTRR